MATSSIFRTPQFRTEESAQSLLDAMTATMEDKSIDQRRRDVSVQQVKTRAEMKRLLGIEQ